MFKTLKSKMSFIYLCLVFIIAIVGSASVINLYKLNRTIDGLMRANYDSISFVGSMLDSIDKQDNAMLVYINIDRQRGIDEFTQNENVFRINLDAQKNNITEHGEKELTYSVESNYLKYVNMFFHLQEVRNGQGQDFAISYYNSTIIPQFEVLEKDLKSISNLNEKAMFDGKTKATERSKNSIYIILIITFSAIICGFLISHFFTNRFLSPIYSLIETVKHIKAGNLNKQTVITSKDEIGELAIEFNNMTKRLFQFEKSAIGSLMSEKNRFTAVVRNISDPFLVLDTNFKLIILNKACEFFFNITEEKAVKKHFLEVIRNGELFEHISGEFASNEERKEKIIHIQSNDEDYYLNVVVSTVKDIENNLTGLLVIFQNVTELKELEKIRTDFIATISHEFKTPLTSIMMGAELLLNAGMGGLTDDQESITLAIKEDCERLSALVNDIMELTKLESGKAVFNIEPCSIIGVIENAYKQFNPIAQQKNVELELDADEELPMVMADFEKISWVLNNLVSNAIKYTNAGDDILITAKEYDGKMHVLVKDTGVGIPEEYKYAIFNKFFQVKGNDLEIRGTGLGLSVAKEIIEAHGGKIWCESKLDLGSTFTFTLNLNK